MTQRHPTYQPEGRHRNKLRLLLPLLPGLLLFGTPAAGAAQILVGQVIDAGTSAPVVGAAIRITDPSGRERVLLTSDSSGGFAVPLPPGEYRLNAHHVEYPPVADQSVRLARNERVAVEVRLGPRPIGLAPLDVMARTQSAAIGAQQFHARMARQRREIGVGRFITRDELDRMATIGINEILSRDPNIFVVRVTLPAPQYMGDPGRNLIMMRHGGRECVPQLYLDGIRVGMSESPLRSDPFLITDLSIMLQPDALEGVEIYRSAADTPPELRGTADCGTIAFWTRPRAGNPFTRGRIAFAAAFLTIVVLVTMR